MPGLSRERWLSIWEDYPYRKEFEDIPRGFVLEADGSIVGSISSVWAKYALGDRELRVVIAGNAAVDAAHRSASIRLFGQQLLQPGIDLYINGSASETASKLMETLKLSRVPQPRNDICLLWPTRGSSVARAGLERRGVPLAGALAWPVGAGLHFYTRLKLHFPAHELYPVQSTDSFSGEFDLFWQVLRSGATQLIGFRDSATLRWRYSRLVSAGGATILTVRRTGEFAGYAVVVRGQHPSMRIAACSIHDLQCVDSDPALVTSLLAASWRYARDLSVDLLEWSGFSGSKRAIAEKAAALTYRLDVWQAFYYARDRGLRKELEAENRWEFSSYDSD